MGGVYEECREQEFMVSEDKVTQEMIAESRAAYRPIGLSEAQLVAYTDMCVQYIHSIGMLQAFSEHMNQAEALIGLKVSEQFAEHYDDDDIMTAYKVAVVDSIGAEDV